jgi:hypothetical protein
LPALKMSASSTRVKSSSLKFPVLIHRQFKMLLILYYFTDKAFHVFCFIICIERRIDLLNETLNFYEEITF